MRHLVLVAIILFCAVPAYARPKKIDRQIAQISAEYGLNRLSNDRSDVKGLALLRLATQIDPDNTMARQAYYDWKTKRPLREVQSNYSADELGRMIKDRSSYFVKRAKRQRDGRLAKLYLLAARQLLPDDKQIPNTLKRLTQKGYNQELSDLLGTTDRDDALGEERDIAKAREEAEAKRGKEEDTEKAKQKAERTVVDTRDIVIRRFGIGPLWAKLKLDKESKEYIKRPTVFSIMAQDRSGTRMQLYVHYNKCRHTTIRTGLATAPKLLGIQESMPSGWKAKGTADWASIDGKLIAYHEGELLHIWEKKWYRDHELGKRKLAKTTYGQRDRLAGYKNLGIGEQESDLVKKYGKPVEKEFIRRPSEFKLTFLDKANKREVVAFVHFNKCRQVRLTLDPLAVDRFLGITGEKTDGWLKSGERWVRRDKKMCALFEGTEFCIYEQAWLDKQEEEKDK